MVNPRKVLERQQRRDLLLQAASRVFARKPFDEASMQEVASEAQIGMQGLYEHFPSKQELYEQVVLTRAAAFHTRADEIVAAGGRAVEVLTALATAYVSHFRDQPLYLPMFIRDRVTFDWGFESRFAHRLREVYARERSRLREICERAVAEGDLRDEDPDFLAQLALDILQASLYHSHRNKKDEDIRTCVARAMTCLHGGVGIRRA